ncbi:MULTISPECIES: NADPH:quinone oxidoreductase family protein [unclassified Meridianimarinicoccus]|uniref:NADPH:quinone oxidoreductase family protein n=1 Tax=unclassified Meridianimarinicoccus TaxID=2923344 RepID=UPI001866DDD1|nr:NADPH:quinone oxidoreductase family protein [Fluviibacterium sp. MJW13]
MRAWQLEEIGGTPQLNSVEPPRPGPSEVQIDIAACGLNFADLLTIKGQYQEKPPLPLTLGMEFAGVVRAVGSEVTGLAVGTRVGTYSGGGGLAEVACVPADRCVPLPDAMPFADAAAFQIAYGTSHVALRHRANLQPGETVLVLGAAGGVGLTAVEIAHRMGARVIACARGVEKLDIARRAGADEVIDSETPDLKAALKAMGGVDVIYDAVGDPMFSAALRACRPGARVLVIGFAAGQVPQIPANYLLVKNITVHGLYWGGYLAFAPKVLTDSMAELFDWYAEGKLRPHISHTLPLEKADVGLELLRSRKSTGKVVITP